MVLQERGGKRKGHLRIGPPPTTQKLGLANSDPEERRGTLALGVSGQEETGQVSPVVS